MPKLPVTLEICTLYKGLPHGIAIITHTDPKFASSYESFRGVGVFVHGQLNNGPFTCINGNKEGHSFSKMQNGRPADGSVYTYFHRDGATYPIDSMRAQSDVPGW
jgi:hypothetical protein